MIIRLCREEDIVLVGEFYDHTVQYLTQNINYPKWTYKEYPSEDFVRKMTKAGCQYAAMEQGKVIGAFVLNEDPQGAYEKAAWTLKVPRGKYVVCHALAIAPFLQGKGMGNKLVEFCVKYAMKQNYQAIRLDVVPDNVPARRLYEKCGFTYVGDVDLERNIVDIPVFSMYERNFDREENSQ